MSGTDEAPSNASNNLTTTDEFPSISNASIIAAIDSLTSTGVKWRPVIDVNGANVHTLADIPHGNDSPQQALDLYFSDDALKTEAKRPVYIHIHGGGWSRGGKSSPFYGGPALCQNAAAAGCVAVAPGYRLGQYPDFVEDAANAIKWVKGNIEQFGGDLSNVFLSGHSAGGHIASLLILRHSTFLAPLGIPLDFFRGLILVSGVYDLFSPLRSAPLDTKNKFFVLSYVLPAFGSDEKLRREASPLLLLDPTKNISIKGSLAQSITRRLSSSEEIETPKQLDESVELNTSHIPSVLILNATFDMGLQENGELMSKALSKYTNVKYALIKGADHASICWNETSCQEIAEFVKTNVTNAETASNVIVRRGKRDKMSMCHDETMNDEPDTK